MDFSVLGPLEVAHDGESISIRRGLPRALLIYLLLHRRAPVTAEVLADRLWTGAPPVDAANAVQRVVSYLRRTLGDQGHALLATRPAGYVLLVDDEVVDSCRFERLVGSATAAAAVGTAAGARRALDELRAGLALWRGEALSDVDQQEWVVADATRLGELKTYAQSAVLAALLQLNRTDEAVAQARTLVTEHPLQEQFHLQLMLALYRSGRQGEALTAYGAARRLLGEELGVDPGPQLQRLERQILQQADELEWVPPPDWVSSTAPRTDESGDTRQTTATHLPLALTSLVGRDAELHRLRRLMTTTRVLTLTGTGGVGKSRLALELARQETARRTWWVPLEDVADPELVAATVARALGVVTPPNGDHLRAIARTVGDEASLLVLDGCEQIAAATAELVDQLQRHCQGLVQLVTSRRPLRVAGEVTWSVPPLSLPIAGAADTTGSAPVASLQLFEQRARAALPAFAVDAGNEADVAAIVVALDGLPLAIELAAAHVDVLPPAGIRQRLTDRFELLQSDQWDAPARQHTLRAAIDSSAALLTVAEREHFIQLGVFAGSFDLPAVEAVTATPPAAAYRLTASLVRQSLVTPLDSGRFRLLESVRAYAADELARTSASPDVRRRHADHLLSF
ncbi:MAG TPA: BTAD domain-containing putative transcriptional regulator, partial [Microlunatus sp.]|nr:BTAD domain-containing putative transcriptional regulator [Microlunatus sp.]